MGNSILDNLTKEDFKASLDLMLNADVKKEKVIILVEGINDIKFVNGMNFNKETIIVEQSYSGKQGINDIMQKYERENRIIAIRDRDYEIVKKDKKIFYYDYCCLEMMMISIDDVFECIYYEYILGKNNKENMLKMRYDTLNQLKYISLFRKINENNNLGINFNRINISNMHIHKKIDIEKLKKQVNERCDNFLLENKEIERQLDQENEKIMTLEELLDITNGHDFSQLFANIANGNRKRGISKDVIESNLRCSFKREDFKRTQLYKELQRYQELEKLEILKD